VLTASSGKAAIELIEHAETAPSLILMDASMPEYSGVATIEQLRARGVESPIVMMSGFTWDHIDDPDRLDHLAGFLQKPFNSEQLQSAVKHAIKADN